MTELARRPTRPPTRRAAGFTLMEILVVAAIIAIMAAIGLAGLFGMRDRAEVQQTRLILQNLANASTEYQAQMGESIDHDAPDASTIEQFVAQARQVAEAEQMIRSIGEEHLEFASDVTVSVRDAWGTPIEYRQQSDGSDYLPPHHRPFFASAGPDGDWGTDDDIYSFNLD